MTAPVPLPMTYLGNGLFQVTPGFVKRAEAMYGAGECVTMEEMEAHDTPRRKAFFATIREIWKTLPEGMAEEFPTPDAMRKAALVATGWCDSDTEVFASNAAARKAAEMVRRHMPSDTWPKIAISGCVLVVLTAKSQKMKAMRGEDFNASADAVLKYLAEKIGVDAGSLPHTEAA